MNLGSLQIQSQHGRRHPLPVLGPGKYLMPCCVSTPLSGHSVPRSVILCLYASGSLWRTSSLGKFDSYWNGFQRYPIMPHLTKLVILCPRLFSHTFLPLIFYMVFLCSFPRMLAASSLLTHCTVSVPLLQVMQLQSVQSYQNKAVPSAALLFVYLERANALPVSLHCNLP